MEQNQLFSVLVQNKVADGYRRAGFSLQKGENTLQAVTAVQFAQLQADPRLAIKTLEQASSENSNEGLSENGEDTKTQHSLDSGSLPTHLTVEQLKAKLTEFNVEFKQSANKAELVSLLEQALSKEAE